MTTGFIGLGRLGIGLARNLARHLAKTGSPLVVFDKSPDAIAAIKDSGVKVAASVAEVARTCDVIFQSLPGPPEVEAVDLGSDGILANMKPGTTVFDLTTNSVTLVRTLEKMFAEKGGIFLDAPVSGGPAGAASGELVVWVGGDKAAFERNLPLISSFSKTPYYVGAIGTAEVAKLSHNMMGYMQLLALAEVFSLGTKAGLDPFDLWEAMRYGMVGKQSPLDALTKQFLPGKFKEAAFALKLGRKDVVLATTLAKELGVPMRLANMTLEEMTEGVARGWGDWDSRAYLQLQLERAGVTMNVDPAKIEAANAARAKK